MAIDQGTKTIAVTSQERTWRINIETAQGADPVVTAFREVVQSGPDGVVISKTAVVPAVSRSLSKVAAQKFTIAGKDYTGAEIATVIAAIADTWRQEDIAAAAQAVLAVAKVPA